MNKEISKITMCRGETVLGLILLLQGKSEGVLVNVPECNSRWNLRALSDCLQLTAS